MIGKDDNQEEVTFKVANRRKFNSDGSLKRVLPLSLSRQKKSPKLQTQRQLRRQQKLTKYQPLKTSHFRTKTNSRCRRPCKLCKFPLDVATNAAASLGGLPHPATGKRTLDLDTGKYWLDVLGMLRDKTKGNLHKEENRLLEGLLADLRMQYVQLVRATEEKLKAQAAQKFSASDILGKK